MSYQYEQHEECKQRLVQVLIEKKDLEEKVKKLTEICERLLDHITREILEPSDIDEQIRKYWGRV